MDVFEGFERFAEPLPDALLVVSQDGVVRAASRACRVLLGLDGDRLRGRALAALSPRPDEVERILRDSARTTRFLPAVATLADGAGRHVPVHVEGALLRARRDGEEPLVLLRLAPQAARVARFVELNRRIEALVHEVSVRRRVERDLWEQREWLRTTLRSIGDAVIATSAEGRIAFMNPVAEQLLGWSEAEVSGRPLDEVFPIYNEYTREPVESPVARVMREGVVVRLANHTVLVRRDGREIAIDDSAAPIHAVDGTVAGIVMIFHEVTDKGTLERELRVQLDKLAEADRQKDEFLAMLAHELRNPLAPIVNAVQVLRLQAARDGGAHPALDIVERQARHLSRMVDDLLDVSRITRGAIQLKTEPLDLRAPVRAALESCEHAFAARGHHVDVVLPGTPLPVVGDGVRLEQVFLNLLQNAVKFTDPGGRIRVEATLEEGAARVSVADSGTGIDQDMLERVFDLFVQSSRSLARSAGGLGIGLTLVRRIVEMHGGSVRVHSDGAEAGSTFVVTMPASPPRAAEEAPSDTAPLTGEAATPPASCESGRRRRVLVVDDNRDAAEMLTTYLELAGHEVAIALDGTSAVEAVRRMRPEVVLLDIGLPDIDGYEVARRLRADAADPGLVIVALSGYGQPGDRRKSREAGFDRHLVKPVEPSVLDELLAELPRVRRGR